jgi:cyclopropane-fatty-acyl-phospholipid synthase
MSVLDVENLRLHYARTLAHWSQRFSAIQAQVGARYGEEFRRAWELYLAGSEAAFAAGSLQLFQVVFGPVETTPPHWTRSDIYAGEQVTGQVEQVGASRYARLLSEIRRAATTERPVEAFEETRR